jgi:rhamnose transport system ATP-binding protein
MARSVGLEPLLRLTGIRKAFGGVPALRDVAFDVRPGEVHALVGENGAGKSTLIRVMTGAHRADEGALELLGRPLVDNDPVRSRRLGIACIYQQPALFPDLTVAENVALGREPPGALRLVDWAGRRRETAAVLARLGAGLDPDRLVGSLSMPEQQLVEIARAVAAEARVFIMDEPTASLSEREAERLFAIVRDMRAQGHGVVYVSHRLDEVLALSDRVTVLRDGRVVGSAPRGELDRAALIRLMVGREAEGPSRAAGGPTGNVVLEVRGLSSRRSRLEDVSFSVRGGEIFGLAGLVGAGRTELARTLFGLDPVDAGEVRLNGTAVRMGSPEDAIALGIAYVPEDRRRHGVVLEMSVAANATLAVLPSLSRRGLLDRDGERALADRLVTLLGVKTSSLLAPVLTLSGGNQQKVALARWLAASPRVLILDEPTQGVDVGAKAEVHRIAAELAEKGFAILLISSDLEEVLGLSDRVGVMRHGRLLRVLERGEATAEAVLSLAFGHEERVH